MQEFVFKAMEIVQEPFENSCKYFHVPKKANEKFPCIKWEKQYGKRTLHSRN
jgi:hypothetical protein